MNRTRFSAIAIAFAALSAGQAMAAGPAYNGETYPGEPVFQSTTTRAQVMAELADAQRNGFVAAQGELPTEFAAQPATQTAGKSRDEVKAELATAQRTGTVLNYYGA